MVVFGTLAQNTESRVEIQLNASFTATSVMGGGFMYSFVEFSRLQLETCGGGGVVAHLVIKAGNVSSVGNIQYMQGSGDGGWIQPNCSDGRIILWQFNQTIQGCNVSIDPEFVHVYIPVPNTTTSTTTVYVLLQRGSILTRVAARTDSAVVDLCPAPMVIRASQFERAFTIQVLQGGKSKYEGPVNLVQLTDVAALTMRVLSNSTAYKYSFDNISVVYSLVDSTVVLSLMPDGKITPALEALCDNGNVCLIETLLESGVCQTDAKCEVQGDAVFVMPLYPWGTASLKNGTYTVMISDIKETPLEQAVVGTGPLRRLMSWIGIVV